jgi:phage baseplate assembly protein V
MDANEIRRLIINLIRKGAIMDVDCARNPPMCRVSVGDPDDANAEGLQTNWLPWLSLRAGTTREWNPPSKGEPVILFCPMGDPAQGVVLCGLYSDASPAPGNSPDTHTRIYPDGATIEYDHATHSLTARLPGDASVLIVAPGSITVQTKQATVKADEVTLDAGQTTCTGGLLVKGAFAFEGGMSGKGGKGKTIEIQGGATFTEDVFAAGVSTSKHKHPTNAPGTPTDAPIAGAA